MLSFDKPDTNTPWSYRRVVNSVQPGTLFSGNTVSRSLKGGKVGATTPNYRKAVKSGSLLPLNYYSRWDYHKESPLQNIYISNTEGCAAGKFNTLIGTIPFPSSLDIRSVYGYPPNISWDGVDVNALLVSAMADATPNMDALVTAIEARQTFKMVKNARNDAKSLIREALRGGHHTAVAASKAWLAWRYGWDQLGKDVVNILEFVKEPLSNIVVTGQAGTSRNTSTTTAPYIAYQDTWHKEWLSGEIRQDISFRARVVAKYRYQTLNAVADVPIAIWEEIPFSFVADWFVNVGDVLAAWRLRRLCSTIIASTGVNYTIERTDNYWQAPGTAPNSVATGASTRTQYLTGKARAPSCIPSLVPSISVNLTSKRLLDAAALLTTRIF